MRHERMPGPLRKALARGDIAQGDDEIHLRRAWNAEMVERFRPQPVHRQPMLSEEIQDLRVDVFVARRAGAVGVEPRRTDGAQNGLRHETQGAVIVADEKDVHGWDTRPLNGQAHLKFLLRCSAIEISSDLPNSSSTQVRCIESVRKSPRFANHPQRYPQEFVDIAVTIR